ncbi:MAG TPA: hypothetical protein VGD87_08375 [Archangium sp.]
MAAPGSRCPHCNAPLTLVDGKAPVECPFCHTLLAAPQRTPIHGGIAVAGTGTVYAVTDRMGDGAVVKTNGTGKLAGTVKVDAKDLAVDGKGHVFIARGSSVEVVSPGGDQRVTLPVATDEVALDAQGRLDAIESGVVSVYEVTIP